MIENPWKGLVSYEETDIEKYKFCGRTEAVGKFYSLLTNNLFSTLYGRTGCGKTSLLRAGIFPLLREEPHRNILLNSAVTYMGDRRDLLAEAGIRRAHILITNESPKECKALIASYLSGKPISGDLRRLPKTF